MEQHSYLDCLTALLCPTMPHSGSYSISLTAMPAITRGREEINQNNKLIEYHNQREEIQLGSVGRTNSFKRTMAATENNSLFLDLNAWHNMNVGARLDQP